MKLKLGKTMGLIAAALLPLAGFAVARPVAECEAMMKANAYAGVWQEEKHGETLQLCFGPKAMGLFSYREKVLRCTWRSDGKGTIWLKPCDEHEAQELPPIKYDAATDMMDLDMKGEKTALGLVGRLAFAREELPEEIVKILKRPLPRPPQSPDREKRFEQMKAERPEGFREVPSLLEAIDPYRLQKAMVRVESVDCEYPRARIELPGMSTASTCYTIVYGRYEANPKAKHLERMNQPRFGKSITSRPTKWQKGVCQESMDAAFAELEKAGIAYHKFGFSYGEGKEYWYEFAIYLRVEREKWSDMMRIFREYIFKGEKSPRYIMEERETYIIDVEANAVYDINWDTGKPVVVRPEKAPKNDGL